MKINITKKGKKIISLLTVGLVLCTAPTGCAQEQPQEQVTSVDNDKVFNEKEHVVIEKIQDPTKKTQQYTYHEGYKPIGISTATYENAFTIHEVNSYIVYENIVPVKASSKEFGTPIEEIEKTQEENKYNAYEHIVSIPYDCEASEINFEYHDGYEIVGICNEITEGKVFNTYSGCILYVNTEPVEVKHRGTKDDTIEYDTFGTIIEEPKTYEK